MINNTNVLITGGAGSIGATLARKVIDQSPKKLIILDNDETKLFDMEQELGNDRIVYMLGDIREKESVITACRGIEVVFHAAALKHVKSCEQNPFEAFKTNIIGLKNVIEAAKENKVGKFIFTSSDKAVNPVNVMGATKMFGERLVSAANYHGNSFGTKFSSVRFGNVLGTRGSFLPLLKKQIDKGGPITVTDPDMTRFYMTEKEAADLIIKALSLMHGGEIFVLKMPVFRVSDFVEATMEASRRKVPVKIIGAKQGEKVYEELMTIDESRRAVETEDMFMILPTMENEGKKARIGEYSSHTEKLSTKEDLKKAMMSAGFF